MNHMQQHTHTYTHTIKYSQIYNININLVNTLLARNGSTQINFRHTRTPQNKPEKKSTFTHTYIHISKEHTCRLPHATHTYIYHRWRNYIFVGSSKVEICNLHLTSSSRRNWPCTWWILHSLGSLPKLYLNLYACSCSQLQHFIRAPQSISRWFRIIKVVVGQPLSAFSILTHTQLGSLPGNSIMLIHLRYLMLSVKCIWNCYTGFSYFSTHIQTHLHNRTLKHSAIISLTYKLT